MESDYFNKAHYTVLQNSSLVDPYIEVHKDFIRSEWPGKNEAWIRHHHMETFVDWLRKECQGDENIDGQLYCWPGSHHGISAHTKGTRSMGIHFTQ